MRKIAWGISVIIFAIFFSFSYDYGIIAAAILIFTIGMVFYREKLWGWIPAIAISWSFIYYARDMYSGYEVFKLSVFGVTLFPIIIWPSVLMLWYFINPPFKKTKKWYKKWMKFSVVYCIGIILFEFIGYNIFGVKLDAGQSYPGWPVLNIFHSPVWMQVAYFLIGITFAGVFSFYEHHRAKNKLLKNEPGIKG